MSNYITIGEYKLFSNCRFCNSSDITTVVDLGNVPLAGGFLKKIDVVEKLYPLQISFCKTCFLLQCSSSINPDILFKDYFYFSSSMNTLIEHFKKTADNIKNYLVKTPNTFIVEIGCNDGEFIKALLEKGYNALGVDPAVNVTKPLIKKGLPIINSYFTEKTSKDIVRKRGQADAIYSFHSLAHIEDMHDVLRGIKILLKKSGYLALEVHYLGSILDENQYDMMYHEHQFYYSYLSLKKFLSQYDMEIFDVKKNNLRGGSIMYFVQNKKSGKHKLTKNVINLKKDELKKGYDTINPYLNYSRKIEKSKKELLKTILRLKKIKKRIVGYGASGRGTIVMNYSGLSKDLLDFVVDDAPAKQGNFMPGTHQKILSSKNLFKKNRPDYAVLFAWPFVDEVLKRNQDFLNNGGKFITPLPHVKIIK